MTKRAVVPMLVLAVTATSCHRSRTYDARATVTRVSPVRKDETGKTLTLDFEISYDECPGTQTEVMRGDAAFAACVSKYAVGTKVPLRIDHAWTAEDRYGWTVKRVGDCDRAVDPSDEASYALVRDCRDWTVNETRVGFQCEYNPGAELLKKCPWFRRR
jgi:hypothetical protein